MRGLVNRFVLSENPQPHLSKRVLTELALALCCWYSLNFQELNQRCNTAELCSSSP